MRHRTLLVLAASALAYFAPCTVASAFAQATDATAKPAILTTQSNPQTSAQANPQTAPDEAASEDGPSTEVKDPEFRAALAAALPVVPAAYATQPYRLRLHNLHTLEDIDLVYRVGDNYQPAAIASLNYFLRDHNTQDVKPYDPREFDLLHDILIRLGRSDATIDVVCGYRTQWTNELLRASSRGVAEHSQHILGHAIDIQIPGSSTTHIRDAALSLNEGGVGYYPVSHFVHVDVGAIRTWTYAPRRYRRGHAHLRSIAGHHRHATRRRHISRAAGM